MTTIILGQHVRCDITGFHGIATQKRETLNGNVQFAVQPKNKEGENALPDAHYIDHHLLSILDAGISDRLTKPTADWIELGSRVRDKVTGLEGIATARATFINGCVYYDLTPKKKTAMFDTNPDPQFVEAGRLEAIVMKDEPKTSADAFEKVKKPGGPSMKVARQSVNRG